MSEDTHPLHMGLAEHGKLLALKGKHADAMRHYREAIRLAVSQGADEVFFRHYTQCVLESLEHTGAYDEVITFCERAEAHYVANPPPHDLARLDRATHHERQGIVLFKMGRLDEARVSLERAVAGVEPGQLPMARTSLDWLRRGLHVDPRRIRAEQDRHRYFIVRADAVNKSIAVALPAGYPVSPY